MKDKTNVQTTTAGVEDNKPTIEIGKFKNSIELLKAYNALESEFTKRSQKLADMEKRSQMTSDKKSRGEIGETSNCDKVKKVERDYAQKLFTIQDDDLKTVAQEKINENCNNFNDLGEKNEIDSIANSSVLIEQDDTSNSNALELQSGIENCTIQSDLKKREETESVENQTELQEQDQTQTEYPTDSQVQEQTQTKNPTDLQVQEQTQIENLTNLQEQNETKKSADLQEQTVIESGENNQTLEVERNRESCDENKWRDKVEKFFYENPKAEPFAKAIAQEMLTDKTLKHDENGLETAFARFLVKSYKSPAELLKSDEFLSQYVFSNQEVVSQIIEDYLLGLSKHRTPATIKGSGVVPLTPPSRPKSLQEAGWMFVRDNK